MKRIAGGENETETAVSDSGSVSDVGSTNDDLMESDSNVLDGNNFSSYNEKLTVNPAWADAMCKILKTNKPKRKKTLVLSRAKLANEKQAEIKDETLDFEIEGDSKVINLTFESSNDPSDNTISGEPSILKKLKKKEWASKGHIKPQILEKDRERALAKIATRGVVQLFNAVKEHQKSLKKDLDEAGSTEHKKAKVLKSLDKRAFLDVLMGPAKSQPVSKLIPKEIKENADNPTWSILRDDFMMKSKLKDWDKKYESEVKDEPIL